MKVLITYADFMFLNSGIDPDYKAEIINHLKNGTRVFIVKYPDGDWVLGINSKGDFILEKQISKPGSRFS